MKNRFKKGMSAIAAAAVCAVVFASCSNAPAESGDDTQNVSESVSSNTPAVVTTAADPNEPEAGVPVNLEEGVSDKMYNRAVMNEGSLARLANAMKKAKNGEEVTIGVIGGSITQGSSASSTATCYASLFNNWWLTKFPDAKINFVNAGIGGTNSYLGVHRADEQLLSYKPDAVIVEFSVNDTDKTMNKYSYDSLVRKILSCDSNPAVILLFTTMEDGTSLQDVHKEIGAAYDLPMLSYHDAVYPEVAAGNLIWRDISPDNIHPNDAGHEIINQIVSRYLDSVYDRLDEITEEPSAFSAEGPTKDYFANAKMLSAADITATSSEGFEVVEKDFYDQFRNNWKTTSGGKLTFNVECRNFGVFFMCTTDGMSGTYEVYVDGERKGKLEADFTGGWGNYGNTKQITLTNETAAHTIEIKPAEGSEDKGITILGLMVS